MPKVATEAIFDVTSWLEKNFDISVAHTTEHQNREAYQGQNAKYNFKSALELFFFVLATSSKKSQQ